MMNMLLVGAVLGIALALLSRVTRFDRDRSYYATVLIVIASYYVLFAFMAGQAILVEIVLALGFSAVAILGFYLSPLLIGVGILLHGVFDAVHPVLIDNAGVPAWWPAFCAGVDVVLGVWVIYLVMSQKGLTRRPSD